MTLLDSEKVRTYSKDIYHIGIMLVLIVVLLGIVSWVFGCRAIDNVVPGWCGMYWGVMKWTTGGQPRVLIVYGDSGLGDPDFLYEKMSDPEHLRIRPNRIHLDRLTNATLDEYDMIIVERARKISTKKLELFMDYIGRGGRLVWTGDAGTELADGDEYLYHDEVNEDSDKHEVLGPWRRKKGDKMVVFSEFIGVEYIGTYCELSPGECEGDTAPWIGTFDAENRDHELVYGVAEGLQMYGDFAFVDIAENAYTKRALDVDFGSNLVLEGGLKLDRILPVIVTTGLGEKVAYYAIPPEMFLSENMVDHTTGEHIEYWLFLESMYDGMLN